MPADPLLVVGAVFFVVVCLTAALGFAWADRTTAGRLRLKQLGDLRSGGEVSAPAGLARDGESPLESRLKGFLPKSPAEMGRLQRQLSKAGFHGYGPAAVYALAELAVPAAFALATIWYFGLRSGFVLALIAGAIGYVIPGLVLTRLINNYKKSIRNGLADALDLLIVCIEAGSGLDQALIKASDELRVSYPALADELSMITTEVRAGKTRLEAFKNFAERTKVDDVQSLVAMLVQTDRFGTSVTQALRTHADVMRTKRRQRAEERAAKLGVKLVFPLVFFLFPAIYVVTLGPAVIQFVRVFFGQIVNAR